MTSTVAQRERAALADLFDSVGPDQPTLDEGWLTSDLLHHVIARERRPDSSLAVLIKPLKSYREKVMASYGKLPWPAQVELFRSGPPRFSPLRLVDRQFNTAEYFIHHEDVRRGVPGWKPRELDDETTQAMMDQVKSGLSRVQLKKLKVGVVAQLPDKRQFQLVLGDPAITLVGAPGELLLWISGRRTACEVEVQGSPAALRIFQTASER